MCLGTYDEIYYKKKKFESATRNIKLRSHNTHILYIDLNTMSSD